MRYVLFALVLLVALAVGAPLYTTQGLEASGFSDDDDRCSIAVLDPSGNIIETRTIQNDCMDKDIAYLDQDCYIFPVDGTVIHTIFLGERYKPAVYDVHVRCGADANLSTSFNATAPSLSVLDFNQFPQILTTMKLTARTETEKDIKCSSCPVIKKDNNCVARVFKTGDNTTTALISDIPLNERGVFTFHYYIGLETAYTNYTLNLTCDDYSTFESTFIPVFIEFTDIGVLGFGFGIQGIIVLLSLLIGVVMIAIIFMGYQALVRGEYDA
jgi:hypothetical protein